MSSQKIVQKPISRRPTILKSTEMARDPLELPTGNKELPKIQVCLHIIIFQILRSSVS